MSQYETNAEDEYNDDEYEEEFLNDNNVAPDDDGSANRADDDDDEQHAQKVNGQIEAFYSQIEELTTSLSQASLKNKELVEEAKRLHRENRRLVDDAAAAAMVDRANSRNDADIGSNYTISSGGTSVDTGSTADVQSEMLALRKKNRRLQDRLDDALSLAPDAIHPSLRDEALSCCRATNLFPELKEKDVDVTALIKIFRTLAKSHPAATAAGSSNRSVSNSIISSQSSNSALFSASDYTMRKIKLLEQELRMAQSSGDEIKSLRDRVTRMNERIQIEKEYKLRAEQDLLTSQKKIEMLGSHMDKLILHMKHEGAHKLRIAEQLRVAQKQHTELQDRYAMIASKSSAKDRLVLELREGSKILEDQLRLMDEKYLELRTKLDYAREVGSKKIKRAEQMAKELRIKFAFANGSTILDTIQVICLLVDCSHIIYHHLSPSVNTTQYNTIRSRNRSRVASRSPSRGTPPSSRAAEATPATA